MESIEQLTERVAALESAGCPCKGPDPVEKMILDLKDSFFRYRNEGGAWFYVREKDIRAIVALVKQQYWT